MPTSTLLRTLLIQIAGACVLAGCPASDPRASAIPEETFVDLSAQLLVVREEGILGGMDSVGMNRRADSLYKAYGLTQERVHSATEYYQEDLAHWRHLLEKVIHRLEQLQHEKPPRPGERPREPVLPPRS
jgi:hypothetical protein